MTNAASNLQAVLSELAERSARGIVARARVASVGLNALLLERLSASAGTSNSLIADPVFESAKTWGLADESLGALSGRLLSPELVDALDQASEGRIPRDRYPYVHQHAAWSASLEEGKSVLVTAGTGAGKTECFLIPILEDILAHPRAGGGVRAILLYPLNALIESQRERLAAWAGGLGGRVRFALYNGDTPETERELPVRSDSIELRSREAIRARPPEILVTNITMLEYLLLRAQDQNILNASRGALRWIVLDEAHSYVGSQAAEMALLLRRVRSAFGTAPDNVRLMATSATISDEMDGQAKLRTFTAALSGRSEDHVAVIEGREETPELPQAGADILLDLDELALLSPEEAGARLAPHPQVQALRRALASGPMQLSEVAQIVFGDTNRRHETQRFLDIAAQAKYGGQALLPWRAHLFHRAQGGVWACPDNACRHCAPELSAEGAGWPFGAVYTSPRARCECGVPVYEVVACTDCGTPHLEGVFEPGAQPRLLPPDPGDGDDFALDAEPDENSPEAISNHAWLAPGEGVWLDEECRIYDNARPEDVRAYRLRFIECAEERGCCSLARNPKLSRLQGLRFGPAFFMGNALSELVEGLAAPDGRPGLPAGGRRALTFSDSRQGVARLAAKLQQEAERTLTRAYLWHSVQEGRQGDTASVEALESQIEKLRSANDPTFEPIIERLEGDLAQLTGASPMLIRWTDLVQGLTAHHELNNFAGAIWRGRRLGEALRDAPERLAEMFLYRELFRRPRIQNNPETMGLLRLNFPSMEERALLCGLPTPLTEAGLDAHAWASLAQAAVDMVFRQNLAVDMPGWMVPLVAPRYGQLNAVMSAATRTEDLPPKTRRWPSATRYQGRLPRLAELVYELVGGSPDSSIDRDRAREVLQALWELITTTAARDTGRGAYRLDFGKAAVQRLEKAWVCPVVRRPYGYSLGGQSPNAPSQRMEEITLPRLPCANRGGLSAEQRSEMREWCRNDSQVAALRSRNLWADLHDRLASFPPFVRAQEHSAQIPRATLKRYEAEFREGRINLLNCSTTMEMGVDIADVRFVVNANVPPSLSNYRQRSGRAGRRGEPFAFTLTFCRDLPLDRRVFDAPTDFLGRNIVAPKVVLESAPVVQRHVNAALLSRWISEEGGLDVRGSIGAFLGAGATLEDAVLPNSPADRFLDALDQPWGANHAEVIRNLVTGTVLADKRVETLIAQTRLAFEALVKQWRAEHRLLLEGAVNAADNDARNAQELRARRIAGEFLLGELARRGFTPAYGFPTDVVSFANLAHRSEDDNTRPGYLSRGTASRTLDQAIREYAPGAEVVIDGLVHKSEGILPAWQAGADASGLEDFRTLWSCLSCYAFALSTSAPEKCPACDHPGLETRRVLRPTGFLAARPAHVGYENLAFNSADPVRLSAQEGEWVALPQGAGRMRSDPAGRVAASASGEEGGGYAICLDCGRAEPMEPPRNGRAPELPVAIRRHSPLFLGRTTNLTHDGLCSGSDNSHRIQRNVHLAQVIRTDVWEWQLPVEAGEPAARALVAALRESLAEKLGVEPAEIGPALGRSTGPAGERRVSIYLHDRAAGGAGLAARMAEPEMLPGALDRAVELLDCPESCLRGCPSCVLRPDLNQRDTMLDRPSALALAKWLRPLLNLPEKLKVLGPRTRLAGRPLDGEIAARLRAGQLATVDLWLHGEPSQWDMDDWPLRRLLLRLAEAGVQTNVVMPRSALTAASLDPSRKLSLHWLASFANLKLVDAAPTAGDARLIARFGNEAFALFDASEAFPGPGWGAGATQPAVIGPAPDDLDLGTQIAADRLMSMWVGNAQLLWPERAVDGPAKGFGKRLWQYLERQAPLEIGTMRDVGVQRISYTDRYLVQPYTLRLLTEMMLAAPGAERAAQKVETASARGPAEPRFLHDNFPNDESRRAVLSNLLPRAEMVFAEKREMPHHRALMVELKNGRRLTLLLDQGFGVWRTVRTLQHDFRAPPERQARALASRTFEVSAGQSHCGPIALTME